MGIKNGELCTYTLTGAHCRLDEALQDGDAFVTWADGTYGMVKWCRLVPFKGEGP